MLYSLDDSYYVGPSESTSGYYIIWNESTDKGVTVTGGDRCLQQVRLPLGNISGLGDPMDDPGIVR